MCSAATTADTRPPLASRTPRWIDDASEIGTLLTHAAGKRLMLAVGGNGGPRNSLLLAADATARQLVIDPPFPALQVLRPGTPLSLSTRIDGAVMDFTSAFEGFAELAREEALLLRWPERLRYLQRRSAYRLGIPQELQVPPVVLQDRRGAFKATLVDLSRFGAGALVARGHQAAEGEPVTCTIRVGEMEFTAGAAVRSCIESLDRLRVGLEFGEIEPADAARLSSAVARLERISLRKAAERRARL